MTKHNLYNKCRNGSCALYAFGTEIKPQKEQNIVPKLFPQIVRKPSSETSHNKKPKGVIFADAACELGGGGPRELKNPLPDNRRVF